jgi:hypothetical protein
MSISVPNTYTKAVEIKKGLARLLAADTDHAVRDMLAVGLQFHTTGFDHPTDGITVPPGFNWGWVMTVPHRVRTTTAERESTQGTNGPRRPRSGLPRRRRATGGGRPAGFAPTQQPRRRCSTR